MHSLYLLRSQARLSRVTKKLRLNGVEAQKFSVEANLESRVGTSLNVVVGVVVALVLVYSCLINSKLRQLETRYSTSSVVKCNAKILPCQYDARNLELKGDQLPLLLFFDSQLSGFVFFAFLLVFSLPNYIVLYLVPLFLT